MEDDPLISIVIPVFNASRYLSFTLDSVLAQTYKKFEVIVVDDGSTDDSGKIEKQYELKDKRICIVQQENHGPASARNTGIRYANAGLITFMDSDDVIGPQYIEHLLMPFHDNGIDISITDIMEFRDNGLIRVDLNRIGNKSRQKGFMDNLSGSEALGKMLYQRDIDPSACAKMYRIQLFDDVRFPDNQLYEDFVTTVQLFSKTSRIAHLSYTDYYYRIRNGSRQRSHYTHRNMDLIKALYKINDLVINQYPNLLPALKSKYLSAAFNLIMKMDNQDLKKYSCDQIILWNIIKRNRKAVFFDSKARPRARLAALFSVFGLRLVSIVYSWYEHYKYC
ncbi:glycosyltransferase family 2 protein [Bifidobacterium sp. ESL0764]|uniref:glycosyltransferase family 2 protein n=1 Tax=Bifidobacterium sp. ESL0764 TaxID=2983228 RepID=UPI0023F75EC1|nr:glycosyltransferase family 2 protein [Bifidobacterium sp. ESL0764]WEV65560.1 glycosyltransferase family 2 protein [Bifidobacterium sp. ESL0764]